MIEDHYKNVQIKVIGVGGAGCNAVNHMINSGLGGPGYIAANTDTQALLGSSAEQKINLGYKTLKGLGAGGNSEIGKQAAIESKEEIKKNLENTDLLFIIAGMGGGTGTGASPIIAEIAFEMGILVIGSVTKPFAFEGKYRNANASNGIQNFKKHVDSLIIISNDKLLENQGNISVQESFSIADETLKLIVQTITDLIAMPAKINLDFADVKRVFSKKKNAFFGFGMAQGKQKSIEATREATSSKLLEASIKGLKNAIINFTGGPGTTLFDINDSIDLIKKKAGDDINILFGLKIDKNMENKMSVAIIGTNFDETEIVYADPNLINKLRSSREDLFEKENELSNSKNEEAVKTSGLNFENDLEDDFFSAEDEKNNKNENDDTNKKEKDNFDNDYSNNDDFNQNDSNNGESDLPPFMQN